MEATPSQRYRAADLSTSPPEKLRLMLIDAALAAIDETAGLWATCNRELAADSFVRARRIVIELLCGVKPGNDELARKVRGLYAFLFRLLTESQLFRDTVRLTEARRLLLMEQQTWREVCAKRGGALDTPISQWPTALPASSASHGPLSVEA